MTGKHLRDFYQGLVLHLFGNKVSIVFHYWSYLSNYFLQKRYKASTDGEKLFIAHDLELINAISISDTAPTLELFKKSINIESLCCGINSASSK